ncbi:MAG: hypothetical protein WA609_09850 [Terriglobales bacterium]
MELVIGIWCAVMSTIQAIGSVYGLMDRRKNKRAGAMSPSRFSPFFISILLAIGTVVTITFGAWVYFAKPFRPTEKVVTVQLPCTNSQQTTGDASTHGNQSPANSGNNNTTTYGSPPPQPPPANKPKSDQ